MDVNSVNKPTMQAVQPPKRAEAVPAETVREAKPKEKEPSKEVQVPPKPVINAQGQLTGQTLNVTA